MFQFTTTNVINSNKDLTSGKPLYVAKGDTLNVLRVNNFKKENVVHIFKSEGTKEPKPAVAKIDLSGVSAPVQGDVYRLFIKIRLSQSSQNSLYANDLAVKGLPIAIEFVWKDNAANTAKALAELIDHYSLVTYGNPIVKIEPNDSSITITATDLYQIFHSVEIEKYDAEAYHGMGKYTSVLSGEITPGEEGFGTYEWLSHNLRLPTYARTRAFALNSDETPIPGATYNEYIIHYCANRGILGMNAVGDVVKSMTTHVFYVNEALASEFEAALQKIAPEEGILDGKTGEPVSASEEVEE